MAVLMMKMSTLKHGLIMIKITVDSGSTIGVLVYTSFLSANIATDLAGDLLNHL